MSSLTTSSAATRRPATVSAASGLLVLVVLLTVLMIATMPANQGGNDPIFLGIAATLAAGKLAAAAGLWQCRRWAAILGFIVTLFETLLALGTFLDDAANAGGPILIGAIIVIGLVTLVLLVVRTSRRAYV